MMPSATIDAGCALDQMSHPRRHADGRTISAAEVDRILSAHRLYLETERKHGSRADLSKLDLSARGFVGLNLRRARFGHALLAGADFSRADLTRANLIGTDLKNASLCGASLTNARGRQPSRRVRSECRSDRP